jgi:hypothetical protein
MALIKRPMPFSNVVVKLAIETPQGSQGSLRFFNAAFFAVVR